MQRPDPVILLTGFGPFPGISQNATEALVPALAERASVEFPTHVFHTEILVTAWDSAPGRVAALIAQHKPALALHFGVARDARGFRIERVAQNVCRIAADVSGSLPAADQLESHGPPKRDTGIDASALAAHLEERGFPVSLSDDAGAYLCNAVLYHSLSAAEALSADATLPCRSGFIHIPADLSSPPLSFPRALEGSLEIIRFCLGPRASDAVS